MGAARDASMCAEWKTLAREFTKEEASEIRNAKSGTTPTLLTVNILKWNSMAQKKRNLIVVVAIKLCAISKFHSKKGSEILSITGSDDVKAFPKCTRR